MNAALKVAILTTVRSQIALSAVTGIREDRISRLVQGWAHPTASERRCIAAALRRSESELFETSEIEKAEQRTEPVPAAI